MTTVPVGQYIPKPWCKVLDTESDHGALLVLFDIFEAKERSLYQLYNFVADLSLTVLVTTHAESHGSECTNKTTVLVLLLYKPERALPFSAPLILHRDHMSSKFSKPGV